MIHFFIGTKAQLIKVAPVMLELDRRKYPYRFIDSAQHAELTTSLRPDFGIRKPDFLLCDNDRDIATLSKGFSWLGAAAIRCALRPAWIRTRVFGNQGGICVVHGDTATALIGALFARRAGLPVAHLEAGLRSYNYLDPFPEELIRVWCMRLSTLLFAPDGAAMANLHRMRVRGLKILTHGNTVLDALRIQAASGRSSGRPKGSYALAACHRLETLKSRGRLSSVVECLNHVARQYKVLFVLHKPTEVVLRKHGLLERLHPSVECLPMQRYFDFIALLRDSALVMADGGSIQEECAALGVPLLILRSRSERKDGLGTTASLARFDREQVARFLEKSPSLRGSQRRAFGSPSSIVAENLIRFDAAWPRRASDQRGPHRRITTHVHENSGNRMGVSAV